jgi:hypothetical protein
MDAIESPFAKIRAIRGSTDSLSNNLDRTFRQGVEKGLPVLLRQNPVVQNHDDAGVGLGADQAPNALTEFQDRKSRTGVAPVSI